MTNRRVALGLRPLDHDNLISVLSELISVAEQLQNNSPELLPREALAASVLEQLLEPHTRGNGGPLFVRRCSYAPNRTNLVLEYNGDDDSSDNPRPVLSFVGSHLDVVPANPDEWDCDPFTLSREGDIIRGRSVTDCLGHCATITHLFLALAETHC